MEGRKALDYRLWPYGEPWDARVDIIGKSIILHSRGGSTGGRPPRNTDYTKALTRICENFGGRSNWIDRILIDSARARSVDESERILLERDEIRALTPQELVRAIRQRSRQWGQAPGAKGGNSTKQVRFDLRTRHSSIIQSLMARPEGAAPPPATARSGGQADPDPPEEVDEILAGTPLDDEDRSFAEGSKKRAWHLRTERNPALVREKKKLFEAEHGRLFCEHCKEDFIEQFGDQAIARACFDAHHKSVMVADMAEGHESQPDDLEILCATCHRAEHARLRLAAKGGA